MKISRSLLMLYIPKYNGLLVGMIPRGISKTGGVRVVLCVICRQLIILSVTLVFKIRLTIFIVKIIEAMIRRSSKLSRPRVLSRA